MLLQLITNQPQVVGTILKNTPMWVWGLLAALLALGLSQLRARTASLTRIAIVPLAMTGFALWGIASAFGASGQILWVMLAWAVPAAVISAILAPGAAAQGTRYDRSTRTYALPGTAVPLVLILGIFLTKYAVGVELTMQPRLAQDATFAMQIAALYGVFNGFFTGRAIRLLRLAA